MKRIDRLTAMILMLQSHRVITAEQISEHFGISVRTVYRDIAALGEAGVPIIAEAGVGYALMRGYHMPPVMFSGDEAAALLMSSELAERFGDASLKKSLRAAMLKVRAVLPGEKQDYLSKLSESISIEGGKSVRDSEEESSLMPIQEAVVRQQCLSIEYNTAGRGEISCRIIEPLGVVFYGHRWHAIAWCRLRKDIRDFRLDRMQKWEVLPESFAKRDDFSLLDYLSHEVNENDLTPAKIECETWALDRFLAGMPAQLVKRSEVQENGRIKIEVLTFSLDYLAFWLMALGEAVLAVSPPDLRKKIAVNALEIAGRYSGKPEKSELY